jgi:hypothetical protein
MKFEIGEFYEKQSNQMNVHLDWAILQILYKKTYIPFSTYLEQNSLTFNKMKNVLVINCREK